MTDDNATPDQAPDTAPDKPGEAPVPFPGTDAPTTPDTSESPPTAPETPDVSPEPPSVTPSLANPGGEQVKVLDGETLAQFAERVRKPVNYIMQANPKGVDPESLRITGKKLLVPEYDY